MSSEIKLTAIYKTFDGGEFVDASLSSIYEHVENVVMLHTEVSWLNERGNTVKDKAIEWCNEFDRSGKVHHINVELNCQEVQYAEIIKYIEIHNLSRNVMVIDCDEIWEDIYVENAKRQMRDTPAPAYRSNMHTYLKTPFFQVDPPYGSPTVFLTEPEYLTKSARGCAAPAKQLKDVWMHHYTYVRETRDMVHRKLYQSQVADRNEIVIHDWMSKIYDKLPAGENLHAFDRWKSKWKSVRKIELSELPPAMRKAKMLSHWLPQGELIHGERLALGRLAAGSSQAVDLGTYYGLSAVILALACDRVHTIDCYEDLPQTFADTLDPHRYEKRSGHSLESTLALADRFGNITAEKCQTSLAAEKWNRGPVDFQFIDASHDESSVLNDFFSWLKHMKIGGKVCFHDNNEIHPGVQSAINKLKNDRRFEFFDPGENAGSLAICRILSK